MPINPKSIPLTPNSQLQSLISNYLWYFYKFYRYLKYYRAKANTWLSYKERTSYKALPYRTLFLQIYKSAPLPVFFFNLNSICSSPHYTLVTFCLSVPQVFHGHFCLLPINLLSQIFTGLALPCHSDLNWTIPLQWELSNISHFFQLWKQSPVSITLSILLSALNYKCFIGLSIICPPSL